MCLNTYNHTSQLSGLDYHFNDGAGYETIAYGLSYYPGGTLATETYTNTSMPLSGSSSPWREDSTFNYDADGQLDFDYSFAPGIDNEPLYDYDPNANRTYQSNSVGGTDSGGGTPVSSESYANSTNRILFDGNYYYNYDPAGNRTAKFNSTTGALDSTATNITVYAWDNANELVSVKTFDTYAHYTDYLSGGWAAVDADSGDTGGGDSGGSGSGGGDSGGSDSGGSGGSGGTSTPIAEGEVDYAYAADGLIVSRNVLDSTGTSKAEEFYINDGAQVALVLNAAGQVTERELYGPAVDQVMASEYVTPVSGGGPQSAGTTSFMLPDFQGSVRDVLQASVYTSGGATLANATDVDHLDYDAFGSLLNQTNASAQPRFTYTGRQYDAATGLYYYRARWYDPVTGAWICNDPLGFNAGQTNLQEYCGNSPTNFVDPSGMREAVHDNPVSAFGIANSLGNEPILAGQNYQYGQYALNSPVGVVASALSLTCFTAGTPVATVAGQVPIEYIEVGSEVWAYDLLSQVWRPCRVERTFSNHYVGTLVEVRVDHEIIESTTSHPYWVVQGYDLESRPHSQHVEDRPNEATTQGRWVDAGYLREGDRLLLRDGRIVPICPIVQRQFSGTVYNIKVADLECYAVGDNNILVHNKLVGSDRPAYYDDDDDDAGDKAFDEITNGVSGFSDTVSGGLTSWWRKHVTGNFVNTHSWSYFGGGVAGFFTSIVTAFANPCEVAGGLLNGLAGLQGLGNGLNLGDNYASGNWLGVAANALGLLGNFSQFLTTCFAAGTPLLTPEGSKPIEEFRVGDLVLSAPEGDPSAPVRPRRVEQIFQRLSPIIELVVSGRRIKTTVEHRFYVHGKGWQKAGALTKGELLRTHCGSFVAVESVEPTGEIVTVYNMRIEEYHTYFVGGADWRFSVWAHNADYSFPSGAPLAEQASMDVVNALENGTSGKVAALQILDQVFSGTSSGAGGGPVNPIILKILESAPEWAQSVFNNGCAELRALSAALEAGVNPAGGTIIIRTIGGPSSGAAVSPCNSCRWLLNELGVFF